MLGTSTSCPHASFTQRTSPSSLRKLHESLSDPKYDGAKTSRQLVLDESDGTESDSASEDAESGGHVSEVHLETFKHETGVKREMDIRSTKDASTERFDASKQNSDLSSNLRKTREEDRKKGKAISRQIASQFLRERCFLIYILRPGTLGLAP